MPMVKNHSKRNHAGQLLAACVQPDVARNVQTLNDEVERVAAELSPLGDVDLCSH